MDVRLRAIVIGGKRGYGLRGMSGSRMAGYLACVVLSASSHGAVASIKPSLAATNPAAAPPTAVPAPASIRTTSSTRADRMVASVEHIEHIEHVACDEPPSGMSCVPGGAFVRGSDDGPADTRPRETVTLSTFYIDRHEVTYAAYRGCVSSGACADARPRYTDFDHPHMPMTGVSWFDAARHCSSQGKQLPSEAQWEKAARGPSGALQPWGDAAVDCTRAVIRDARGRACGLLKRRSKPEVGRPWDVGSRPAGVYGLFDMVGNAWEWTADWYAESYATCGEDCRGVDPRGPCQGASICARHRRKVLRGGSWYWDASHANGIVRRAHAPDNRPFHHFGFRCAATPEQARRLRAVAAELPAG